MIRRSSAGWGLTAGEGRVAGNTVKRLVAETVDVERETALVVGSDNVLLGVNARTRGERETANCCLNGVLSQWFVSQFGKIDGHI